MTGEYALSRKRLKRETILREREYVMTGRKNGVWSTMVTLSAGIVLGLGVSSWIASCSDVQEAKGHKEIKEDQRLTQLEQAVTALTHSPQRNSPQDTIQSTCAAPQANEDVSRQTLAQIIREELQLALAKGNPEREQARAQEIAIAQALNSPENREAYQSAADVVRTALAAGRWTDENARTFRDAFVHLTNDQRTEVMQTLAPAINRGEVVVETSGPLF
jgi:hypothetical protein